VVVPAAAVRDAPTIGILHAANGQPWPGGPARARPSSGATTGARTPRTDGPTGGRVDSTGRVRPVDGSATISWRRSRRVDSAARSAETVNASHTAGRMSRQARQRQRYFVSFAARDIGERQPQTGCCKASVLGSHLTSNRFVIISKRVRKLRLGPIRSRLQPPTGAACRLPRRSRLLGRNCGLSIEVSRVVITRRSVSTHILHVRARVLAVYSAACASRGSRSELPGTSIGFSDVTGWTGVFGGSWPRTGATARVPTSPREASAASKGGLHGSTALGQP